MKQNEDLPTKVSEQVPVKADNANHTDKEIENMAELSINQVSCPVMLFMLARAIEAIALRKQPSINC